MAYIEPQVSADLTALAANTGLINSGISAKTKLYLKEAQKIVGPATGDFSLLTSGQKTAIINQARTLVTR